MPFTAAEKYKCAERELKMRYQVYERRVDAGQMKRATADREIALMEEIAADYRAQDEREGLPLAPPPVLPGELERRIDAVMSDLICPHCGVRYLPVRGACVCETQVADRQAPRPDGPPTEPGPSIRNASPLR